MRKFSLILAVLLLAAPAWARVDVTMEQTDINEVTVSYNVTGEPNKVRAFALDITLDDANIIDVNTSANVNYTIYPGSVVISGGEITDEGTAVADPCDYPADTQPGPNSPGVTIEMGALYSPPNDSSPNSPPNQGVLLKFYVDGSCTACIAQNEARGGVVLTDPDEEISDFNSPCIPVVVGEPPCLIGGNAGPSEHTDWVNWGSPACWCYQYQCRGDINGKKTILWRVQGLDLDIFRAAFFLQDAQLAAVNVYGEPGVCADLNHKKTILWRVQGLDLEIFRGYFFVQDPGVPSCDAAPVITGPYNFWTTP